MNSQGLQTGFLLSVAVLLASLLLPMRTQAESVDAYIVSHGWHTGIVIPADIAEQHMPFLRDRFFEPKYYEFGWGDSGFYQAEEITTWLALEAVLTATDSVMHVVAIHRPPAEFFAGSEMVSLPVDEARLNRLAHFIATGYAYTEGKVTALALGIYGDSQFYRGAGTYHLMNTCNKWTAEALASAGFDIDPAFMLTADQVMTWLNSNVQ